MSAYEDSGEIIVKKKVVSALVYVGATYAIYAVVGIICLFVLWFNGNFSSNGFSLEGLLMALGCVYGLIQIIVFLGYGLVSVPKAILC